MFEVIFEVRPKAVEWDSYLDHAKMLRPELEQVEGFVDNVRYRSLTREGWILSISSWRDEKSVVRWRTHMRHHELQRRGREEILSDYHLRVGQVTRDTQVPKGYSLTEQRLDETEAGEGKAVTLITAKRPQEWAVTDNPDACAEFLGLNPYAAGLLSYDVFEAVSTRGDLVLLCSWIDNAASANFEDGNPDPLPPGGRLRRVRVVRDYGMVDRREAPQYFPEVVL